MTAKMIKTAIWRFFRWRGYHVYGAYQLPLGFNWMLDVERLAKPDAIKTIFDVGAHEGQTAILLSRRFPQAKIYSFEPLSATFHKLQQNTAALENVTCENCALGREKQMIDLYPKNYSQQNSLLPELNQPSTGAPPERIQIHTADETLRLKTIDHLNLLKTDTEGFDLEVIAGAKSALSEAQIDMIVAEVGFHPERRHHTYLPDVQSYLFRHGYELYCIYDQNHYAGRIDYADALFVSPKIQQLCNRAYAETFVRHAE
jgi:FkbM family methyltransferase